LHTNQTKTKRSYNRALDAFYRSLAASGAWPPGARAPPLEWALAGDCTLPALMHPEMAVDAVQFCALEAAWLAALLADPAQHGAFR
jgi:hypothetical protein